MTAVSCTTDAELAAERAVVGAALCWPACIPEIDLEPRHLGQPACAAAWGPIREMHSAGEAIDVVTVAKRLEGKVPEPLVTLSGMAVEVLTAANVGHYAKLVRNAADRRRLALVLGRCLVEVQDCEPAEGILARLLEGVAEVQLDVPGKAESIRTLLMARFAELSEIHQARESGDVAATGIPTGLVQLDAFLGGLQRGIITVVAGRPGMGKSSFGMACVRHAASRGIGVHVFSLEDTRSAYCDRVLSGESRVPAERIRSVDFRKGDLAALGAAMNRPAPKQWLVDDRSGISAGEVVRSVRRHLGANQTKLVLVDYVQLLRGEKKQDAFERISEAMNELADAAKRDNMVYLVLAQLNRECEKRDNKRPQLSDLKSSGAIEERAKCVLFLYRPAVYREKQNGVDIPESVVEILVHKNNQGRTGISRASWDGETIRMY